MASKVDSTGLSVISEERGSARKRQDDDYEPVCQRTRSSYVGGHKKKLHPLMLGPGRSNPGKMISLHSASKNNLSEFTQRIMSAKLLRVKQVQNQLNETQIQLNELINENRILRNLQKRQEGALKRYEGNHAELPQLIRSHNEEIRTLKVSNKLIKTQLKECSAKLKERENELEALRDNYNKLKKLSTEKNLLEREKLQKKVEELQDVIKEQEEKIQVLSRKVLLESKNYRHHLNIEILKHKETQKDLNSALSMISKLESQLMAKERQIPGSKVLLRRDSKNLIPALVSKSSNIQPKIGISVDSFLSRDDEKQKIQINDSPEPELEFLNSMGSLDETPSPTPDIFPNISKPKKITSAMETTTEITYSKSETCDSNHEMRQYSSLKIRKTPFSKGKPKFSTDIQMSAKFVTEKLSQDMEEIDDLAQKVNANTSCLENDTEVISILEESGKPETDSDTIVKHTNENSNEKTDDKESDGRRSVPKRKLEHEKEVLEFDIKEELSEQEQKKLENMTKTWNDIKSKIKEDRKKAEEKIKELNKVNSEKTNYEELAPSDSENEKVDEFLPESDPTQEAKKDIRFLDFLDDSYILQELQKTDKIFNKLTNGKQKVEKTSSSFSSSEVKSKTCVTPKPKQQVDIKSFRTESKRDPKYLQDFQNEYQKQNLLKALKAIDVGKDPDLSTEESEASDSEFKKERFCQKNGLKHIQKLPSGKSSKDLMSELFGGKHAMEKNGNIKLELGTIAGVND